MESYVYALMFLSIVNIIFGIYTLKESRVTTYIKYFAGSLFCVGFWGIGLGGFLAANSPEVAMLWAKFHYVASILVAYYLLVFALSLAKEKPIKPFYRILLILPILAISVITVCCNDLLLKQAVIEEGGNVMILYKPGHIVYAIVFASYFIATLVVVLNKLLKSSGIIQKQMILIFVGLLISGVLGMVYNLILPLLGNYKLVWVGPQFTVVFLALMFIGMVRYQLFNIRLLAGKILFTGLTSVIMFLAFLFFTNVNKIVFGESVINLEFILFGLFCAFLYSTFYESFRDFVLNKIQSKIITPGLDTSLVLKEYNRKLGKLSAKNEILNEFAQTLKKALSPEYISIITKEGNEVINKQYVEYRDINYELIFETIEKEEDLKDMKYLAPPTLMSILQDENSSAVLSLEEFINELQTKGLVLLLPIVYEHDLLAVCVLGEGNSSSSTYIDEEIEFLESLSDTTAVYLTRAILFEQLSEFNSVLQQKVDEQTKELQIKVKELEEARRKENDMIDIMGHELRTPATIVKLNAEMLRKYIDSNPEEYAKYLDRIRKAIDTEIGLINTLLTSAKLEGDRVEIKEEKVDIKESIEMSVHGNEKDLKEGVKIYTDIQEGIPFAYADRIRVMEVLDNLISNAVKYTDKGRIDVKARFDEKNIIVSVSDTGKGIPKEDIPKLGSKFYRANNYLESKIVRPGGTGLGLYVTFRLVKLMGGKINVESEEGKGSTFTFTLPRYINQKLDNTDTVDKFTKLGLK